MEDPTKKNWGLQHLHKRMLLMLEYIHDFCVKNEIDYCLAYGSALGAVRHNGFIPWDDDVDIYMTAESYIKFRKLHKEKGNIDKYYLQELGFCDDMVNFSKLRMNGTTFLESATKELDIHHGLYVDIFILHNTDGKRLSIIKMLLAGKYLTIKRLSNIHYSRRKLYNPILALLRLFPCDFGRKAALKVLYKYDNLCTDYYFEPEFASNTTHYPKDLIFPAVEHTFEDVKLMIPAQYDKYLRMYYGDYMKVPDIKDIFWDQHSSEWHIDKDYKEVLKREFTFKDEYIG